MNRDKSGAAIYGRSGGWIGRTCLVATVSTVGAVLRAQPSIDDLRMPPAIAGEASVYVDPDPEHPFSRYSFEIGPGWARTEQFLPNGSFGWALVDFHFDTVDESIVYDARNRRATRDKRLNWLGNSAAEPGISPLAWVRTLRVQQENGNAAIRSVEGALEVWRCSLPRQMGRLSVFIDPAKHELVRAELDDPRSEGADAIYRYQQWTSLGDGTVHHPSEVLVDLRPASGPPSHGTTRLSKLRPLPPDATPTAFTLPRSAVVVDYINGVVRNGAMEPTGTLDDLTALRNGPLQPTAGTSLWRWLAVGVAVALFASAAIVYRLRRPGGAIPAGGDRA